MVHVSCVDLDFLVYRRKERNHISPFLSAVDSLLPLPLSQENVLGHSEKGLWSVREDLSSFFPFLSVGSCSGTPCDANGGHSQGPRSLLLLCLPPPPPGHMIPSRWAAAYHTQNVWGDSTIPRVCSVKIVTIKVLIYAVKSLRFDAKNWKITPHHHLRRQKEKQDRGGTTASENQRLPSHVCMQEFWLSQTGSKEVDSISASSSLSLSFFFFALYNHLVFRILNTI